MHDSVEAMAHSYATAAVEMARDVFKIVLDYGENSLMEVDAILAQFAQDLPVRRPPADEIEEMCKVWGCYLGEVVRRRFGGEWSIDTYPGKRFATLTLRVNGNNLFPSLKIHRRLTEGEKDSIWSFYKMVKEKLDGRPGGRIQ